MPRRKEATMKKPPWDRRGFLRLCVVAGGSIIAAACQKALTEVVGTSTAFPSPTPSVKPSLVGRNRDVWSWVESVKIDVSGECEKVLVYVDGQEFEARPEGETFTAEVSLSEGENQVSAACVQPRGGALRSDPVIFTER